MFKNLLKSLSLSTEEYSSPKFRILTALLIFQTIFLNAQDHTITGKVIDSESGEVLPGATVLLKGTSQGAITDTNGSYVINASPEDVLVASLVGYKANEIKVGNLSVVDFSMSFDTKALDPIVVIGYGAKKRTDLTGAIVSVRSEDLTQTISSSLDQALQGRAAGVHVQSNSGQPGGGVSVRIRGTSSFNLTNEPLYVVDGVPISGSSFANGNGGGNVVGFSWAGGGDGQRAVNALSGINPNDIETVEILKDASAAAIYGSRASNGVVLITTKTGANGQASISYDGYYGTQRAARRVDVLGLVDYARLRKEFSEEFPIDVGPVPPQFLRPEDRIEANGTDWQEEIFNQAIVQSHDISISGGNSKSKYTVSAGYFEQGGIVIGSDFQRISGRVNIDSEVNQWMKLSARLSVADSKERIVLNDDENGVITLALRQTPDIPVLDLNGGFAGPTDENLSSLSNPVAIALLRDLTLDRTKVLSNARLTLEPVKGLSIVSKFGTDFNLNKNRAFNPTYEIGTKNINDVNSSLRIIDNALFWINSNFATYTYQRPGVIQGSVMIGNELQKSAWDGVGGSRIGFASNQLQELDLGNLENASNQGWRGSSSLLSYFSRVNLTVLDKYLLTATLRADASSRFGPSNKWGVFPSFALAWKADKEAFLADIDQIETLKLRLGYGQVGNQEIPNFRFNALLAPFEAPRSFGGIAYGSLNFPNPNLKWEVTTSYNIGLDLSMYKNRVELTLDYYLKNTNDLLSQQPLASFLGTGGESGIGEPWVNFGSLQNRGIELTMNTVNVSGPLEWSTSLTFSRNRNKVTKLSSQGAEIIGRVQFNDPVTKTIDGQPIGQFFGYIADGVFENAEEIRNHAVQVSDGDPDNPQNRIDKRSGIWIGDVKFKDLNNDGFIDEKDRTFIGSPHPDFIFGLNNDLKYRNFDFSLYLLGNVGGEIYNFLREDMESLRTGRNQLSTVTDRAQVVLREGLDPMDDNVTSNPDSYIVSNSGTNIPRVVSNDVNDNSRISTRYIEDATFMRIKTVSIGYSVPSKVLKKIKIKKARVYFRVQNAYTFSKYLGHDPEIGSFDQSPLTTRIDNGNYPQPRTYAVGVNLKF